MSTPKYIIELLDILEELEEVKRVYKKRDELIQRCLDAGKDEITDGHRTAKIKDQFTAGNLAIAFASRFKITFKRSA